MNLGPTIDGRISPQRQLSSPSALDGSIISTASEQEVFIDFENLYMYVYMYYRLQHFEIQFAF